MAALGDLVVRLSAETAQFTAALDKASYKAEKSFNQIASGAKLAIGAFATLSAGSGFASFIKQQIDAADQLNKVSQKVGIAVEDLSKLKYAASLADVDISALQVGLVKLSRGAVEASQGTGEAKEAFDAMGISVKNTDGSIKTNSELLNEVADRFAGYADGANKAELAVRLFGKSGADLIPLLNGGSAAIKQAGDELQRFGGVVTKEAAMNAELFNDNITRLTTVAGAFGKNIANAILPYLTRMSEELLIARSNGLGLIDTLSLLGTSNVNGARKIGEELKDVNKQIDKINSGQKVYFNQTDRAKELEDLGKKKAALLDIQKLTVNTEKTYEDSISRRYLKETTKAPAPAPKTTTKPKAEKDTKALIDVTGKFSQAIQELIDKRQLAFDTPFLREEEIKQREYQISLEKQYQDALTGAAKFLLEGSRDSEQYAKRVATYNENVKEINETHQKAIEIGKQLYEQQEKNNASWMYGANVALSQYINQSKNVASLTGGIVTNAMQTLDNTLLNIIMRTTSVSDAFRQMTASILQDIARLIIRQTISAPIAQAISGFIGSYFNASTFNYVGQGMTGSGAAGTYNLGTQSNYPSLMSSGKALGGDVIAGTSYLVGEKGAEMFTPAVNGTITPNSSLGGETIVNQTINIQTGVAQTVRTEIQSMMPRIMEATKAAVAESKLRGGTYGRMMA